MSIDNSKLQWPILLLIRHLSLCVYSLQAEFIDATSSMAAKSSENLIVLIRNTLT